MRFEAVRDQFVFDSFCNRWTGHAESHVKALGRLNEVKIQILQFFANSPLFEKKLMKVNGDMENMICRNAELMME
jgi:hypothetical protein